MELDAGYVVAIINFLIGIMIIILSTISTRRLKGGMLSYVSNVFLVCGILYIVHAGVEVLGLRDEFYAITALVATLLLGFCIVILAITTKVLGGK